jgi:fructosamine-3-kinase
MDQRLRHEIERLARVTVTDAAPLGGGCVADVRRLKCSDGSTLVAKLDRGAHASLDVEGRMLRTLRERSRLPVPDVVIAEPHLLVMSFIKHDGQGSSAAADDAALRLAQLHGVEPVPPHDGRFGLDHRSVIAGLEQPSPWTASWPAFFGEHRLVHMARAAREAGRIDGRLSDRVERLAGRLDRHLPARPRPSLVHGDLWSGNALCRGERLVGCIDPAIYYAHDEVELAFIALFSTFGRSFFDRYAEHRPIEPGFFEERCALYNLYPLLVHARLFGGHYVGEVSRTLDRFGA